MQIIKKLLLVSAFVGLSVSAEAGIYDFGKYSPEDEGMIPDDMLEAPDTPEAWVSGVWLTKDYLGRDIKFVVLLHEGIPYVGQVGSDPIPVTIQGSTRLLQHKR